MATTHDAVVNLITAALRAEAGVQRQKAERRSTDYYAGRRAGFICGAAIVLDQVYGEDYEQAKHRISQGVREAGESWSIQDLTDPEKAGVTATLIATAALLQDQL